jgi:hypothetical protein
MQGFIKVLFQMIWADGRVSPNEVHALFGVLRSLDIPHPKILCLMDQNLTQKPTEPPVPLDEIFKDRNLQMEALKSVMTICMADGKMQPEILGYLEGTIIRMGITASELEAIRKGAVESSC